jgi:LPS sulfotransferase NodH
MFLKAPNVGINKFVIIFSGRSGSNLLASMLDSHPDILCHHELFNPNGVHKARSCEKEKLPINLGTHEERDKNPWGFLNRVFAQSFDAKAVGFKLSHHENRILLLSLLLNRRIKKIVLRRDNLLDAYISLLIAQKTGEWILKGEGWPDKKDQSKLMKKTESTHVEYGEFVKYERNMKIFYGIVRFLLKISRQSWIDFEFNEILNQERMKILLDFIGITDIQELKMSTKRQNPALQSDKISNYKELSMRMKDTNRYKYLTG